MPERGGQPDISCSPTASLMEELLHPRHPLAKYYQSQLEFLRQLPDKATRAAHARLFRLGNARLPLPATGRRGGD